MVTPPLPPRPHSPPPPPRHAPSFPRSPTLFREVPLEHPDYPEFAKLGLKWGAVPSITSEPFSITPPPPASLPLELSYSRSTKLQSLTFTLRRVVFLRAEALPEVSVANAGV